jgi:hypothetical protein
MEAVGAASNRTKVKRREACVPWGEPANGGKPRYPSDGRAYGRRFGAKFCVLTQGDLPVSDVSNHDR